MEAIDEVQKRGDSMMSGIKKQRELLAALKSEIKETKDRLEEIDRKIGALNARQADVKEEADDAERDTERIIKLKMRIKETVKKMENYKAESEHSLRKMEMDIERLVVEMEERRPQLSR